MIALLKHELRFTAHSKMDNAYYETVDHLEKLGIDQDYIQGWVGGYLRNPEREEQRVTDAYKAGYEDGQAGVTDKALDWQRS